MYEIGIDWDEDSIDHIWMHGVEPDEVDEVVESDFLLLRARSSRHYAMGQTSAGRYLAVVLGRKQSGRYRCVTARSMTDAERRHYVRVNRR